MNYPLRSLVPLAALTLFLLPALSPAQVGPGLWIVPFGENEKVQAEGEATFFFGGDSNGPGSPDATLFIGTFEARVRFAEATEHPVHLGTDLIFINIDSADPALPNQLVNVQFAAATQIAKWDDWAIAIIGGIGTASNEPFSDGDSWYGRGDILATWQLDERSFLQFGLNCHGNRSLLPDIPLPMVSYTRQSSETLRYTIGLPVSAISWEPADRWLIELVYVIPFSIDATVSYEVIESLTLFISFKEIYEPFHLEGDLNTRRLFFQQSRIEGGARWKPMENLEIILAIGWAFGTEISRGFDARNTTTIRELSDEPYIRAGLVFRY